MMDPPLSDFSAWNDSTRSRHGTPRRGSKPQIGLIHHSINKEAQLLPVQAGEFLKLNHIYPAFTALAFGYE